MEMINIHICRPSINGTYSFNIRYSLTRVYVSVDIQAASYTIVYINIISGLSAITFNDI